MDIPVYDDIKIERMTCGNWGKKLAFFTLLLNVGNGSLRVHGMCVVETDDKEGKLFKFVGVPSKESKEQGKYDDIVWMDKDLKQRVTHLAIAYYEHEMKKEAEDIPF